MLATRHGGYLLQIPAEAVDVHAYESLVAEGQQAFEKGDDESAARAYRQALDLWQGPALVDVRVGPVLQIEAMRLEESRLVTRERRIDADLRLGRHAEVTAELMDLTARHPEHEGLHSQAMVALYRCGRQAAALDVYHRLRRRLVDELGVEPSPQLQRLHQAMLAVDPPAGRGLRPAPHVHLRLVRGLIPRRRPVGQSAGSSSFSRARSSAVMGTSGRRRSG
ncbi:hypothetical protein GCM10020256_00270 [Streptomyces thermocoprophilus]